MLNILQYNSTSWDLLGNINNFVYDPSNEVKLQLSGDGLKFMIGTTKDIAVYYYNANNTYTTSQPESSSSNSLSYVVTRSNSSSVNYNVGNIYNILEYDVSSGVIPMYENYYLKINLQSKGGDSYGGDTTTDTTTSTETYNYSGGGGGGASFSGYYTGESPTINIDPYGNIELSSSSSTSSSYIKLSAGGIGYYNQTDIPEGSSTTSNNFNAGYNSQGRYGNGGTVTSSDSSFITDNFFQPISTNGIAGSTFEQSQNILSDNDQPSGGNPGVTNTNNYGKGADGVFSGVSEGNPIFVEISCV